MGFLQSKYTIELRYIDQDPKYDVFGFPYDFYEPQLKASFEKKFIDYFYYNEIGFETVARFRHELRTKLNTIMPFYRQLYASQLAFEGIDPLLNKDLVETFVRDLDTKHDNLNNTENTADNISKVSSLNNGLSSVSLEDSYLTATSGDNQKSNIKSEGTHNGNTKEQTVLTSKGNIGITSPADMLEKWRGVMINIDEQIFEECRELFFLLY